jgi:hypothetical protein
LFVRSKLLVIFDLLWPCSFTLKHLLGLPESAALHSFCFERPQKIGRKYTYRRKMTLPFASYLL